MNQPIAWLVALTLTLSACANACEDGPTAKRTAQNTEGTPGSGEIDLSAVDGVKRADPSLPTINWEKFLPFAPDSLDGYVAEGPAEGRTVQLSKGAALPTLKRVYHRDKLSMELEFVDATHAPMVRTLVEVMQNQDQSQDEKIMKGIVINGYKGVIQWHPETRAGRAAVVIEGRYVVNVKISPTTSPDPAIAMLKKLDLEGFAALKPKPRPDETQPTQTPADRSEEKPGTETKPVTAK